MKRNRWRALREAGDSLVLWRSVLTTRPGRAFRLLVAALATGKLRAARRHYADLFAALAEEATDGQPTPFRAVPSDAWQGHLLTQVLTSENPFTRMAAHGGMAMVAPGIARAAAADLRRLAALYHQDAMVLRAVVRRSAGSPYGELPLWTDLGVPAAAQPADVAGLLHRSDDWGAPAVLTAVAEHVASAGAGLFGRYRAFRWVHDPSGTGSPRALPTEAGALWAIPCPDPVTFDDLVGYAAQRRLLLQNTEHFLAGAPANNVLLYGDRGTGKSASVKALLHAYADRRLRLIEVAKGDLADLPLLLGLLRSRLERFILFIDDLSFEDNETWYKDLKVLLEGSLETRPPNVVLYATSNRRHLVKERFADRGSPSAMASGTGPGLFSSDGAGGEVHAQDTLQEKLSLSDRFGLTLTYATPSQGEYLALVDVLADRRGLGLERGLLRDRATAWAAQYHGRSGRSARQFVDFLVGEAVAGREPPDSRIAARAEPLCS